MYDGGLSHVKMIDYGLLQPFPDKEEIMNAFYGCSEYIAPEVFEGKVHDNSGSWAIGISMFVMLTGFFPFDSRTKIKE